jgi:hypothetical protein
MLAAFAIAEHVVAQAEGDIAATLNYRKIPPGDAAAPKEKKSDAIMEARSRRKTSPVVGDRVFDKSNMAAVARQSGSRGINSASCRPIRRPPQHWT